jgi:hypothetical protein
MAERKTIIDIDVCAGEEWQTQFASELSLSILAYPEFDIVCEGSHILLVGDPWTEHMNDVFRTVIDQTTPIDLIAGPNKKLKTVSHTNWGKERPHENAEFLEPLIAKAVSRVDEIKGLSDEYREQYKKYLRDKYMIFFNGFGEEEQKNHPFMAAISKAGQQAKCHPLESFGDFIRGQATCVDDWYQKNRYEEFDYVVGKLQRINDSIYWDVIRAFAREKKIDLTQFSFETNEAFKLSPEEREKKFSALMTAMGIKSHPGYRDSSIFPLVEESRVMASKNIKEGGSFYSIEQVLPGKVSAKNFFTKEFPNQEDRQEELDYQVAHRTLGYKVMAPLFNSELTKSLIYPMKQGDLAKIFGIHHNERRKLSELVLKEMLNISIDLQDRKAANEDEEKALAAIHGRVAKNNSEKWNLEGDNFTEQYLRQEFFGRLAENRAIDAAVSDAEKGKYKALEHGLRKEKKGFDEVVARFYRELTGQVNLIPKVVAHGDFSPKNVLLDDDFDTAKNIDAFLIHDFKSFKAPITFDIFQFIEKTGLKNAEKEGVVDELYSHIDAEAKKKGYEFKLSDKEFKKAYDLTFAFFGLRTASILYRDSVRPETTEEWRKICVTGKNEFYSSALDRLKTHGLDDLAKDLDDCVKEEFGNALEDGHLPEDGIMKTSQYSCGAYSFEEGLRSNAAPVGPDAMSKWDQVADATDKLQRAESEEEVAELAGKQPGVRTDMDELTAKMQSIGEYEREQRRKRKTEEERRREQLQNIRRELDEEEANQRRTDQLNRHIGDMVAEQESLHVAVVRPEDPLHYVKQYVIDGVDNFENAPIPEDQKAAWKETAELVRIGKVKATVGTVHKAFYELFAEQTLKANTGTGLVTPDLQMIIRQLQQDPSKVRQDDAKMYVADPFGIERAINRYPSDNRCEELKEFVEDNEKIKYLVSSFMDFDAESLLQHRQGEILERTRSHITYADKHIKNFAFKVERKYSAGDEAIRRTLEGDSKAFNEAARQGPRQASAEALRHAKQSVPAGVFDDRSLVVEDALEKPFMYFVDEDHNYIYVRDRHKGDVTKVEKHHEGCDSLELRTYGVSGKNITFVVNIETKVSERGFFIPDRSSGSRPVSVVDENDEKITYIDCSDQLREDVNQPKICREVFKQRKDGVLQNFHGELVAIDNDGKVMDKQYLHAKPTKNGYEIIDARPFMLVEAISKNWAILEQTNQYILKKLPIDYSDDQPSIYIPKRVGTRIVEYDANTNNVNMKNGN